MMHKVYALVVDDMPANHDVVQAVLSKHGINADCVNSGVEAIELIRDQKKTYNMVFMDQMMPGMDGIETLRIIRQELGDTSEYAKNIPVIALTGDTNPERFYLKAGFDAFLSKPVRSKDMAVIIKRFLPDYMPDSGVTSSGSLNNNCSLDDDPANSCQENDPNIAQLIDKSSRIPGLDIKSALKNINWDWETCIEVIKSFTASTPALLEILKDTSMENMPRYCITVHGIKSVVYSFGANLVGGKAKILEEKSRNADIKFVKENNEEFIQITEKLLKDLYPLLEAFSADKSKPQKEKPDPALIAKLLDAAENYSIRNLEEGIVLLDEYSYILDADLVTWLKAKSINSDFTAIYERLSKMVK